MTKFNAQPTRHVSYQQGLLWVGTNDELSAYNIDTGENQKVLTAKRDIQGDYYPVMDVLVDQDVVWISYKGDGIYGVKYNSQPVEQIAHFYTGSGLPENNVYSLQKINNTLWATTSQGLLALKIDDGQFSLFTHQDGLVSNEFNEGTSALTVNGELLLGSVKGVIKITPKNLVKTQKNVPPIISEAKLLSSDKNSHLWSVGKSLKLTRADDVLSLHLSTLDYTGTATQEFEYWFDSPDIQTQRNSTSTRLTLTDIPVGTHILNIRARSLNGLNFSPETQLLITVKQSNELVSTPGYITLVLSAILLIWLTYKLHSRRKSSQKLLEKILDNEQRLELALLDERRGIWDCHIDKNNYRLSTFTIYQYLHEPMELSLEKYMALVHSDDLGEAKLAWQKFLTGESEFIHQTYRSYFYKKWFWNRISGKISAYDKYGFPERATGIWSDINHEKRVENNLSLYSSAFESTQDIIIVLDKALNISVVNKAFEYTTGFAADDLIGKSMVDIASTRFTHQETDEIKKQVRKNNRWHGQSSVPRKNAPSFPVDVRINVIIKNKDEIGYVIVMSELVQSKESDKPFTKTSFYDRTTGLPNKTLAFDRLRQQLTLCKQKSDSLSLIFLGVDRYSKLKSILKPGSIDSLITDIASRLLPYIQKDDLLSRYEPDIFLIVLRQYDGDSDVIHTVNQLLRELSKPFEIDNQLFNISACAGISSFPDDGENWSELITKGETALAQTKQQGSNLFKYYHEGSNKKALERIDIENKLSRALSDGELFLVFQPVLDLKKSKIIELDINIRWRTSDDRIVYPSQFLPIVSELGMSHEFSDWLINKSLNTLHRWNQEGLAVCININLSVDYLLSRHVVGLLKRKLTQFRINPKFVFISVLEDDSSFSRSRMEPVFKEIYALGLNMVLDDFGKIDASIQNLRKLKFHSVKFSRSLTRNISKSQLDDRVLTGLLDLLNRLKIGSVAKGIENKQQLDYLVKHHCRYGQGYHISDPLNESQVRQYLMAR